MQVLQFLEDFEDIKIRFILFLSETPEWQLKCTNRVQVSL